MIPDIPDTTTKHSTWGCSVQDAEIVRGKIFRLSISDLKILPNKNMQSSKIPLMGYSGSGKSAMLNLLSGLEWPKRGKITWAFPDGESIEWDTDGLSCLKVRKLRQKYFGFAFQDSTLVPYLKVCDNLSYPLLLKGHSRKEAINIVSETLCNVLSQDEKAHLSEFLQRFSYQLSGGQRQRIALVQAIIHDPFVLFADEPTGSLDRSTRRRVMDVLFKWADESPTERLLLWVTHHENDPNDAGVSQRLYIYSHVDSGIYHGNCKWQQRTIINNSEICWQDF